MSIDILMLQPESTRTHHKELFVGLRFHLYENNLKRTGVVLSEGEREVSN